MQRINIVLASNIVEVYDEEFTKIIFNFSFILVDHFIKML